MASTSLKILAKRSAGTKKLRQRMMLSLSLDWDARTTWEVGLLATNEAKVWLTKAADNGYPQANYLIGRLMETLDYTAAPESYRKAAEIGFPLAQYRLGLALATGRGIPIDRTEAYIWLLLSLEAHVDQAATPMSDLESFMGTTATESAKTRARELENTVTRAAHASSCQGWAGELDEVPTVPPPDLRKFCP